VRPPVPGSTASSGTSGKDRRGAVVDQDDLVAGEGELVAATRRGAVDGREELQARPLTRIFDRVPRLVGELAEVHLPGVARGAEHVDVGAGAEHPLLAAADDDGTDFGVLEADALEGVAELDVHPEVVRVELELVALGEAALLVDVERESRDGRLDVEAPVLVGGRFAVEANHSGLRAEG
jgi:hypothetical protein